VKNIEVGVVSWGNFKLSRKIENRLNKVAELELKARISFKKKLIFISKEI
jgi:hypothetical protein